MKPGAWARLSPQEKGTLVRQWKRFADWSVRVQRMEEEGDPVRNLHDAQRYSLDLEAHAKARAGYLFSLRDAWYRVTFEPPSKGGGGVTDPVLPEEMFEQGQSLDDVLWEMHPSNLFDVMEEEALSR